MVSFLLYRVKSVSDGLSYSPCHSITGFLCLAAHSCKNEWIRTWYGTPISFARFWKLSHIGFVNADEYVFFQLFGVGIFDCLAEVIFGLHGYLLFLYCLFSLVVARRAEMMRVLSPRSQCTITKTRKDSLIPKRTKRSSFNGENIYHKPVRTSHCLKLDCDYIFQYVHIFCIYAYGILIHYTKYLLE